MFIFVILVDDDYCVAIHDLSPVLTALFSFELGGFNMYSLSYSERLTSLNLYSVQRRRDRYIIIYVWKMLESKVLNFNPPIISLWNERRDRMCVESHVATGHLGSICYNSFRWKAARLFNNMSKNIRNLTVCSTLCFKKKPDLHLSTIPDLPNT